MVNIIKLSVALKNSTNGKKMFFFWKSLFWEKLTLFTLLTLRREGDYKQISWTE